MEDKLKQVVLDYILEDPDNGNLQKLKIIKLVTDMVMDMSVEEEWMEKYELAECKYGDCSVCGLRVNKHQYYWGTNLYHVEGDKYICGSCRYDPDKIKELRNQFVIKAT